MALVDEIRKKQHELDDIGGELQDVRTFVEALKSASKNKLFDVANTFAWSAVLAMTRIVVIDLSAWVDSLLPPRPQKKGPPQLGWLKTHLQGPCLRTLSKHPAALARVFGKRAARRGHPDDGDVARLEKRLFKWAQNLRQWRNRLAHPYAEHTATVKVLRFPDLAKRHARCAKLMNDLRLILEDTTLLMRSTKASTNDVLARDVVDLILIGTIDYAVAEWAKEPGPFMWQKRDAYYARLHRRPRSSPRVPFNRR